MSDNIVGRIDEMGKRIDDLESSIADLVNEAQNDPDIAKQNPGQQPKWAARIGKAK